ncbi:hypothetical protein [Tissierella sp. P1]|uniref:hypothetical protein n=1 Tax=Tissierella sp. P1 TaxID=1280483 RepID=UPI0013030446|nr:hypothetical protein [Tissierella sp. P1]
MIDKYKVAADIKKDNPKISHKEALEFSKEAARIYFEDNCTPNEAMRKAKEVLGVGD